MIPKNLVFVDVETTGMNPVDNRIIEIGIVRVEDGVVVKEYSKLVNPMAHIDPFIQNFTGITPDMIEGAPTFYEIIDEVEEILSNAVFVAHNVRFDYGFVKQEFKRFGKSFSSKQLCTVKLSRQFYPGHRSYSLSALIERHGFVCPERHRALDDAKVCFQLLDQIKRDFDDKRISDSFKIFLQKPSLPGRISQNLITSLPESPGIYILYGEDNSCLYVGKSINIRSRVKQHFMNDYRTTTDMKLASQVTDIEAIPTSGELSALLLESQTIKKRSPIYNKLLRSAYGLLVAKRVMNDTGHYTVEIGDINSISIDDLPDIIGVFRSHKEIKKFLQSIVKAHGLCGKLLGMEKTKEACFYTQLGWCSGACTGNESALTYNIRFEEAIAKTKIRPWRFSGPIAIREGNIATIVDKWCIVGTLDGESDHLTNSEYDFDYDSYKILARYIAKKEHLKYITTLPSDYFDKKDSDLIEDIPDVY
jgi:DNA polymerase III subunit epsilon